MEEIYKPDPQEVNKIELYVRSTNDILGDLPNWLIHTGSHIVYGIIILLILGTALFKYPDVIKSGVTVDDLANVEWITANRSGKIDRFFVENESRVKHNDTLGILKNAASITDVRRFCRVLSNVEQYYMTNDISYLQNYPFDLIMGEMTAAYEQFTQAVRTCLMYQEFDLYPQKQKYLKEELRILEQSNRADEISILKVKRELFELKVNHKMELGQNRRMLELAYENMVNSLKTWDANYLIKSNSDGVVVWGKSWGMSNLVNEGDTLCTVVSERKGHPVGHIKLSQEQIAEIAPGNQVNIELTKYPTHTYGYLLGEVVSISYIPYNKSYAVEVGFPDHLVTTNKKKINYEIGLSGKAEIITSSRSVLSRIFAPIYQLFNQR
jgi:multidrug resistance efflux pump